ncbi:MAG: DUF4019 domain-containing protein [Desulfarculaceae bacterium]|nr:DUF4019 domain-containing protein [Desulfarculaceae bacterium]MCF8071769.1 DUF4019 domain-containing protein [Desulfarculaceae bacterium]MCF8101319.1 DUF4019 domain-containing protein [Desulfarculaceae bacterium]MCF8117278.1 DUF4019 domain-containing protein [Desulfarculaceae bacterium]
MRRTIYMLLVALLLLALPWAGGAAEDMRQQAQAQKAALAWLDLVDRADWAGSYQTAHANLRSTTDRAAWDYRLKELRGDLGDIQERKLVKAEYSGDRPNPPARPYWAFVFATQTQKAGIVEESVTCRPGPKGSWRVSGYFIDLKL